METQQPILPLAGMVNRGNLALHKKRSHGDLLVQLDHHEYVVWTVKIWLNTIFTASYDCSVAHITFKVTENDFEVIELNKIQGPDKWADGMLLFQMCLKIDEKLFMRFNF